jgi:RNA polymerase sigma factor (sigma-70 family)
MLIPRRRSEVDLMGEHGSESDERPDRGPGKQPDSQSPSAWDYRLAVLRHYRAVYNYSAALLGSAADAEDVTQETFLRYGLHGAEVRKTREWLIRVAKNLSFDKLRAASRLRELSPEVMDTLRDDEGPEAIARGRQLSERLQRLLRTLPEPQRSLVVLFDMQGMTGEECSRILGISVNQVKVYLED